MYAQVEPTKRNLRLMVLEDVLHYHPECKDLLQPPTGAATAMAVSVSAERGDARSPSSFTHPPSGITSGSTSSGRVAPTSKEAAPAGYAPHPPTQDKPSASAAATEELLPAIAEEGGRERRHHQQAVQGAEASRALVTADAPESTKAKGAAVNDDEGSQEELAWPPEETVGPAFGDRPGWVRDSGDVGFEDGGGKAVLAVAAASGRSGAGSREGTVKPEMSRFEGGAGGGGGGNATLDGGDGGREGGDSVGNVPVPDDAYGGGGAAVLRGVQEDTNTQGQRGEQLQAKDGNGKVTQVCT